MTERPHWPTSAKVAVVGLLVVLVVLLAGIGDDTDGELAAPGPTSTSTTASTSEPAPASTSIVETTGPTAPATTTTTTVEPGVLPIDLPDIPATALVDRLTVAAEDPAIPTYLRDRFGDDAYDPATGCNTRERVLIEESLVDPTPDDRCRSTTGRWRSAYDGIETTDPADLEVDHFVPLADAWRSGAWRWDDATRLAFANDLTSPDTLNAVSASSNRSKGDRSPDEWLPPDLDARCDYVSAWVRVKVRWALAVTPPEKATLVQVLSGC